MNTASIMINTAALKVQEEENWTGEIDDTWFKSGLGKLLGDSVNT